jgi:hypothetical protein
MASAGYLIVAVKEKPVAIVRLRLVVTFNDLDL